MPVSRNPARPPSGSPSYSPDDLPVYRGGSTGAAPIACTITLTGDISAAFGGQPLDISGQSVSKTVPASPADSYTAGGPAVPVSWSGWRAFAYQASDFTTSGNSFHALIVTNNSTSASVQLAWYEQFSTWLLLVNGVAQGFPAQGTISSKVAIRIDGTSGDAEVFVDGSATTKSTVAALGSVFSGETIQPVAGLGDPASATLTEGDTYEAQIYTSAADLADLGFPAGTLDWCGNPLPPFNPVALPDLLAYCDIRQAGTLFEDTAGVTPVDAATYPIGRWDAVGPSGAPNLTQGTAMSRPLYQLTPTRAEFDLLDDSLSVTLPAISGGQIVIVSPLGIWIDSLTFAGGTFTIGPSGYTGGPAGLLSLLSGDVTAVYILDSAMSAGEQAALVAFETARGSAGLITLGAELKSQFIAFQPGDGTASYDSGTDVWSITRGSTGAGAASRASAAGRYLADYEVLSGNAVNYRVNNTTAVDGGSATAGVRLSVIGVHSSGDIRFNNGSALSGSTFRIHSFREVVLP